VLLVHAERREFITGAYRHANEYIDLSGGWQTRHTPLFLWNGKMSVRIAFAAALKFLRTGRGLRQQDLSANLTQSHVSQIESGKTSPSLEAIIDLSSALQLHPVALMALVCAAHEDMTAGSILELAKNDLQAKSLLDISIALEPEEKPHPRVAVAALAREQVQTLKAQGYSQADIARELEMAESTVRRHWHRLD
jgi:transcriptional regulator with XRE-family HTH domain